MASKLAATVGPHTAGIFADMTVDGPEIGTLVIIFDRAKNLPNRKSMGKQNPYCAARLGKEAKKTDTDQRGGQTPRWDQEIRFTVHDSPDYHNLKLSVFSEDKKTDLIGEAWVNLDQVIVRGGGRCDQWQSLTCKGKYAGELRIEMTYYDSRPKPEGGRETSLVQEELRQSTSSSSRVKRRPLPAPSAGSSMTPDMIPPVAVPSRAKHGPRDYRTPQRSNSSNPEPQNALPARSSTTPAPHVHEQSPMDAVPAPRQQQYVEFDQHSQPQVYDAAYQVPDFLPEIPPRERTRPQSQYIQTAPPQQYHMPHTNEPSPIQYSSEQAHYRGTMPLTSSPEYANHPDNAPEPYPSGHAYAGSSYDSWQREPDRYVTHDDVHQQDGPPPPPIHSNSAPTIPLSSTSYAPPPAIASARNYTTPQEAHRAYNASPRYAAQPPPPQQHPHQHTAPLYGHAQPSRPRVSGDYQPPSETPIYSTPPNSIHTGAPSSLNRSEGRPWSHRHSMGDLYNNNTPSKSQPQFQPVSHPQPHPHPRQQPHSQSHPPPQSQSQHMPLSRSPQPFPQDEEADRYARETPPMIKPRAVSPAAPRADARKLKNTYSIQHPVRAFESSDNNPLSQRAAVPMRKSVSPRPSFSAQAPPTVPYGPDSFDMHNPNARPSMISAHASPHSPYQIRPGTEQTTEDTGPIVGWHGQEIDPSDHLPVDSWAPEPQKKSPTKTYGLGREVDFGPRHAQTIPAVQGRPSKDTVINVRSKPRPEQQSMHSGPPPGRNVYAKHHASVGSGLREHANFNPSTVSSSQPDYSGGHVKPNVGNYTSPHHQDYRRMSSTGYDAPVVPPKVPLEHYDYPSDALAREVASIDIGASRNQRMGGPPSAAAYVPVRNHRDRHSNYY